MKRILFVLTSLAVIWSCYIDMVRADDSIFFDVKRLSDRTLVLRLRHNPRCTNIVAVKTTKGIVVVDTEMSYHISAQARKMIENEFEDHNIAYVVNTHHHWDHTTGNQTFRDVGIIGHRNCVKPIMDFTSRIDTFRKRYKDGWIDYLKEKLKEQAPGSAEEKQYQERIRYGMLVYDELSEGFIATPPTITFEDRMTLYMGDCTVHFMDLGMCHSNSDILTHIPEEQLLIVGDAFNGRSVKYIDENATVPRWLDILDELLVDEKPIALIVSGHGDLLSREDLINHRRYIRELWFGVQRAITEGLSLEAIKAQFTLENRFPYVKHLRHTWDNGTDFHVLSIENVWKLQHEQSTHEDSHE